MENYKRFIAFLSINVGGTNTLIGIGGGDFLGWSWRGLESSYHETENLLHVTINYGLWGGYR